MPKKGMGGNQNTSVLAAQHHVLFGKRLGVLAFLQHVARGEQQKARAMLKKNKNLLRERVTIFDYAQNEIRHVNAFELAAGAEDMDMLWRMMDYVQDPELAEKLSSH